MESPTSKSESSTSKLKSDSSTSKSNENTNNLLKSVSIDEINQEEQKLEGKKNQIEQLKEDLTRSNYVLFDQDFNKYNTINKIDQQTTSTLQTNQQTTSTLPRDESFIFEDNNYQLDKIHSYKSKFCKFFLFENLKKKYYNFYHSLQYYLQNYGDYTDYEYNILSRYIKKEHSRNSTYDKDKNKPIERNFTLDEYDIFDFMDDSNLTYEQFFNKYFDNMFTNYFSKLEEDQYIFYLSILKNLINGIKVDENHHFVIERFNDIENNTTINTNPPSRLRLRQVFSMIKVFESIIFFYESVKDINNFYKHNKINLLNKLSNLEQYSLLKENFENNEFQKINDIIINNSNTKILHFEHKDEFYIIDCDLKYDYKKKNGKPANKKITIEFESNLEKLKEYNRNDELELEVRYDNNTNNVYPKDIDEILFKNDQKTNDEEEYKRRVKFKKKRKILEKKFNYLFNYKKDMLNHNVFNGYRFNNSSRQNYIKNDIRKFPHKYFVYKVGTTWNGDIFKLVKIESNDKKEEINHFLKYSIYKETFILDDQDTIIIPTRNSTHIALELDRNSNSLIIPNLFVAFYPLYLISNIGCNNNNFYLHYFDINTNSLNSISFHFNIFLNNYRFHLKKLISNFQNETFLQSKIKIEETNKDFLVSNIFGYDPQIVRAKDSMDVYIRNFNLFHSLNDNEIEIKFPKNIIYIKILKIFQEIMFEKYDFNGIKYDIVRFDKTIKIHPTDDEYRIIKYPDGTKYFLSTEEEPNDNYFKYLERYDK